MQYFPVRCNFFIQFFNNGMKWNTQQNLDRLNQTFGRNIPRMPREMFIYEINNTLSQYQFNAERADRCSTYNLAIDKDYNNYVRQCYNPWFQPGFSNIISPCGVSGGRPPGDDYYPGDPYGKGAETYSYPNMPSTQWTRGSNAEVII